MLRHMAIVMTALAILTPSAWGHRDRMERPTSLSQEPAQTTVSFPGARVIFQHDKAGSLSTITIDLGSLPHRVPDDICAKLRKVQVETVRLVWDGNFVTPDNAPYFYIRFAAGTESEKAFGELAEISLIFRQGQFSEGWVKHKVGEKTWSLGDLRTGQPFGTESIVKP